MRDGEIAAMRQDYTIGELLESSASPEPWELFSSWFEIARNTKILEPNLFDQNLIFCECHTSQICLHNFTMYNKPL